MGLINSKDGKRIDTATSNSDLSNLRYVITEKPKWKVFKKREVVPIPAYQTSVRPIKGCPCGASGPCKQKVTPKGVTIHYPQKKKKSFPAFNPKKSLAKSDPGYFTSPRSKLKTVKSKKFPTWRLDKISYGPLRQKKPKPY